MKLKILAIIIITLLLTTIGILQVSNSQKDVIIADLESSQKDLESNQKDNISQIDTLISDILMLEEEKSKIYKILEGLPLGAPLDSIIVRSYFGSRRDPFTGLRAFHHGVDLSAAYKDTIYATGSGIVIKSGWKSGYGKAVVIKHDFGYETLYGHMSGYLVEEGDTITRGTPIGLAGSTGRSIGTHLHYEVSKDGKNVDPLYYINYFIMPDELDTLKQ